MKKTTLRTLLAGTILCGFSAQASAVDATPSDHPTPYGSNRCDWLFCEGTVTVSADWLHWIVKEENLNVATEITTAQAPETYLTSYYKEKKIAPEFKFENGFKCCIGYELPGEHWEASAIFTYLPLHARTDFFDSTPPEPIQRSDTRELALEAAKAEKSDQPFAQPRQYQMSREIKLNTANFGILRNPIETKRPIIKTLEGRWDANYSNLDLDMARRLQFGDCFSITPHMGFRAFWMYQKFHIDGRYATILNSEERSKFQAIFKEKIQGFGAEGGLWANWELGSGFALIGHFGGSILYSHFRVKESYDLYKTTAQRNGELAEIVIDSGIEKTNKRVGIPTMDYFLGLQTSQSICGYDYAIWVGWEQHILFNINQLTNGANLSAQGITAGLAVSF